MVAAIHFDGIEIPGEIVERNARRIMASLARDGVREGDAVALLMRNEPRFLEAALALRWHGAYAVPINWHAAPDEVEYILADCGTDRLIAHTDLLAPLAGRIPAACTPIAIETPAAIRRAYRLPEPAHGLGVRLEAWLADEPATGAPRALRAPMLYTSGTTGRPKGVRRPPTPPDLAARALANQRIVWGVDERTRALAVTPLYHSAPFSHAMTALMFGTLVAIEPRFDPAGMLATIERLRLDNTYLVPTLFVRLLALPQAARHRLDSLRHVIHGAAPCPVDIKRAMIEWLGPVIHEFYGSTEGGLLTHLDSDSWLAKPGSVGKALPGVSLLICDEHGEPLPALTPGIIHARPETAPDFTYHNAQAMRAEASHPSRTGFFAIGDIGYLDEEGDLFLCDRAKDLIISGGANIYPAEIEAVLVTMPGVIDCAVFGIPDAQFGEAVMAVVQAGAPLTEADVHAYLRGRIAAYKIPRRVEFADQLPREDSGKIFKRKLREPYWTGRARRI